MRIVRQLGLLLVVVGALCAVAASSASAITGPLFLFHGTGSGTLLASAGNVQELTTAAGTVQCKLLKANQGAATLLRFLSVLVLIEYTSCEVPGLGTATIAPVHYLIDANGLATLDNNVVVSVAGGACTITLPAAKNRSLKNAVLFDNNAANKGLLLLVHATGITSSGAGACPYAEESVGTASGTIHVVAEGGTLRWDKNS